MTKRRPFGSHDPNVRRSGESITSSIPSVEEALRLKRKKKKYKTLTLGNDGSFLIDSTSKTPRISNRTKELPPRHGTTRHLRRLEQSLANRTKQGKQQKSTNVAEIPNNTSVNNEYDVATNNNEDVTVGSKRKEHSGDHIVSKKKLKGPVKDSELVVERGHQNHGVKGLLDDKKVAVAAQGKKIVHANTKLREGSIDVKRDEQVEVVPKNRLGRNVAAEYLHKHRDSNKKTTRQDVLMVDEEADLPQPEITKLPTEFEKNVELKAQENEDAMMDCASDDESLHLSPETSVASPVPENVEEDKAWVLRPPVQQHDQPPVSEKDYEGTENQDDEFPRLSMTTHAEDFNPLRTPSLVNHVRGKAPSWAKDPHRKNARPIITKGMLSRARQSKPDNEDVLAAMLKSGPPYTGKKERNPTSEAPMIGTTIGINSHERCDSVDGSEVTMLTTDSYLNDLHAEHTRTTRTTESDDTSEDIQLVDKNKVDRRKSPEAKASSYRASMNHEDHSTKSRVSSIREGNQVICFEHNGVMIPHPPLPSGWIIRMSQSKQRPFYSHPDHGSTWHCPVILSHRTNDSILKSIYQPSFINVPTRQNENVPYEDDTESEDSEMWSRSRQRNDRDVESVSSRQSQTSLTSRSSAARSMDTTHSIAEAEAVEVTDNHGSELSLSSSVVSKDEPTATRTEDDVEEQASPLADEKLMSTLHLRHDDDMANASPEMPFSDETFKSGEEGSETHSQSLVGSGTPRSVFEAGSKDAAVSVHPDAFSPRPGVARVSLLTEATAEEPSPMVVEELVSTANFRWSNCGVVAMQENYGGVSDDEELVMTNGPLGKAEESIGLIGVERDDTFLALLRESQSDNRRVSQKGDNSKVHSRADNAEPAGKDLTPGDAEYFEPGTEKLGDGNSEDFDVVDDDILEPAEVGAMETDTQSVSSKIERSDEVHPTSKTRNPIESRKVCVDEPDEKPEAEQTMKHVAFHRNGSEHYDEDVTLQENNEDFEAEVDDVVFGVDHDDVDLSPQAKRLSPIGHINSFDIGDDSTFTKTSPESDTDGPVDVSPSTKNNNPVDHDGTLDNGSVEGEEVEASQQDQHDEQLSAASSFDGTTSMGDALSVKWRGYSYRVLHPPHPLCHLMRLEALIKAALRRAERRKKTKKSKKSFRQETRKTSTKLVFE